MAISARTPWHLWVVGGVSALWNAIGATDYTLTQLRSPVVMAGMSPDQIAWIDSAPTIALASWAFGVWGALLGSLLLLARSRYAVWSFAVSLAGLAVNTVCQMIRPMPHMESAGAIAFHILIWAIAIALLVYALRMRRSGVLR